MPFEVTDPILCSPYTRWVKNAGLGLAIPYAHNGERHDYQPDFVVRLAGSAQRFLLPETKGHDELYELDPLRASSSRR